MTVYLIIRVVNIILGFLIASYLIGHARSWRARLSRLRLLGDDEFVEQLKLFGYAVVVYLLASSYASIESAGRHVPGGYRIWFITLSLLLLGVACLWPQVHAIRSRLSKRKHR